MRELSRGLIAVAAAASAVLAVTAVAAQAATTYTPTGTSVDFVASSFSIENIEANQTWTCAQFGMAGSVVNSGASRTSGAAASALPMVAPSGCSNPLFGHTPVVPSDNWSMSVTGDAIGTSWPARLNNVSMTFYAVNCTFVISGAVSGRFDTATQKFTPVSGASGLTFSSVPPGQSLCITLDFWEGDTVAVGGSWTNTGPALNIANP